MTHERDPVVVEPPGADEGLTTPLPQLVGLVGGHRPLLIGHDHYHIGTIGHRPAPADLAMFRSSPKSMVSDALANRRATISAINC